ncbi:MAG: L-threonine 3-dehydrogenase [Anaerolineae bacterium]
MTKTMHAILKCERTAGLVYVEDYPVPEIKAGEVLVKVLAGSICGTDIHIFKWDDWAQRRLNPPFVVGHEIAGVVAEVAADVTHVKVGDPVSLESHVICNTCYFCRTGRGHLCENTQIIGVDRDGGFAEFITIPAQNVWKNDPNTPLEIAVIEENLGNAVHTVMAQDVSSKYVLVTGCGPVGLMAITVAKAAGARRVIATDISDYRLHLAEIMGADVVVNAKHQNVISVVEEVTEGEGVDVLLEMSGAPSAINEGFNALKEGGEAALLGLTPGAFSFDLNAHIVFKGAVVRGIVGRRLWETWYQTHGLLHAGVLNLAPLVTHQFPMREFEKAYQTFMSGESGKIMLVP